MSKAPNLMFFTKGVGRSPDRLVSFEHALRDAKIAPFNQVFVSSIFPPHCKIVPMSEGLKHLDFGEIIFAVRSRMETNEANRLIAASIGVAIPSNPNLYGYLTEHEGYGETDERCGAYAEYMALNMLITSLGHPALSSFEEFEKIEKPFVLEVSKIDPDKRDVVLRNIDPKTKSITIITKNITQSAIGDKNGMWTTVVAAGVLIKNDQMK
ncbi:MAG: arginine decarboxylase, pyruvoyl-dependent [Candidatus Woesearchaeota archaeon]